MSLQIQSIILYNSEGQQRIINFKLGKVNIITGKSKTGKSSLLNIIEYCFGQSDFKVPEGIIRDTVEWYAVLYKINDMDVFIAKPKPSDGALSQKNGYIAIGSKIDIPEISSLSINTNDDGISDYISSLIGISPNLYLPKEGESRRPLEAKLSHTKFYLYQKQGDIANQDILFYKQNEQFVPQAIKDTLPYFLGIYQEDRLKLINDLRVYRRKLKIAEAKLQEAELITINKSSIAQQILSEAKEAGIIEPTIKFNNDDEINKKFLEVLDNQDIISPKTIDDRYSKLEQEYYDLSSMLRIINRQLQDATLYANELEGYMSQVTEQKQRLESINLIQFNDESDLCPLCNTKMGHPIATITAINESLKKLKEDTEHVDKERPRLRSHLQKLIDERDLIAQKLEDNRIASKAILLEKREYERIKDDNSRKSRILGRISLYLDTYIKSKDNSSLKDYVKSLQSAISGFERELSDSEINEMKDSILSSISSQMSKWANDLELEYKGYPYRLDINKLTVVVDKSGKPISMKTSMGSAENWLGCHLIALLALHRHFIENKRPVPNFIIMDQPTQVYFPPEKYAEMEGMTTELGDDDRIAVKRLFKFILQACNDMAPNLQIIITDHANLDWDIFQDALVEAPWRGNNALIPQDWYNRN